MPLALTAPMNAAVRVEEKPPNGSIFVPNTFKNFASHSGWAGLIIPYKIPDNHQNLLRHPV